MNLFFREAGQGTPLIILHGLFGSSDNWYSFSKTFAETFRVFTVDQRNHGQSPHSEEHDYKVLTYDLEEFIIQRELKQPVIIGHSMGGKTAMNFAVRHPDLLSKLIVVDIMPKKYPVHHDSILEGLKAVDVSTIQSRTAADEVLQTYVPEASVRQFLLKNLARKSEGGFEWKINLHALEENIEAMGDGLVFEGQFAGPALFVKGVRSNYYKPGDEKAVQAYFPNASWVTLETGHWVQAEKPQEFAAEVLKFLSRPTATSGPTTPTL